MLALSLLLLSCTGPAETGDTEVIDSGDTHDSGSTDTPLDFPELPERRVIYQLVPRVFSNTTTTRERDGTLATNGVGRFNDINATALDELHAMGITDVWFTGVLRQATLTDYPGLPADDPDVVKGRAGSFYAVRDYFDVCPDYASAPDQRMAEFEALVDRTHDAGMGVFIDLVPNHVARGYDSVVRPDLQLGASDNGGVFFDPTNHFFYLPDPPGQTLQLTKPADWNPAGVTFDGAFALEDGSTTARTPKATGNNITSPSPSENDWYETVKLNWGLNFATGDTAYSPTPATWLFMDEVLASWQAKGVDGFRVDFAHFVPDAAWTWLIDRARQRDPDVFFYAEAYDRLPGLLDAGFDAVYHDAAYDTTKAMAIGNAGQNNLNDLLGSLPTEARPKYLHYLENHDERRIASPLVYGENPDDSGFGSTRAGRQVAPLLYLYTSGPVLVYNGQEVGEDGSGIEGFGGDDGRTSIFDYWSLPALQGWVNNHAYDGANLTPEQASLRAYYADLLALANHPVARGTGYWGLEYINNSGAHPDASDALFSYARYEDGGGALLLVVTNFDVSPTQGTLRLPAELLEAAGLDEDRAYRVTRVLDERGATDEQVAAVGVDVLAESGVQVGISGSGSAVFLVW